MDTTTLESILTTLQGEVDQAFEWSTVISGAPSVRRITHRTGAYRQGPQGEEFPAEPSYVRLEVDVQLVSKVDRDDERLHNAAAHLRGLLDPDRPLVDRLGARDIFVEPGRTQDPPGLVRVLVDVFTLDE